MACHIKSSALAAALLLSITAATAAEYRAADVAAFDVAVKSARAGDVIVLENGEWRDAGLVFRGEGTAEAPITLKAAEAGKVKLTGDSSLRMSGQHLVAEGLWFHNAFPQEWDVVMFREDSKKLAHHCTLRDCAITQDIASTDSKERKWVSLYGMGHRVESCRFEGKTSKGTLLVAWLPEKEGEPPAHFISKNFFGPRPRLGKNGGEIIRLGDSDTSMQSAGCTVADNIFVECNGEVECISNKSCDNKYAGNVFHQCQGTLTLRHGNRCLVEGNWFDGGHQKFTGGIRIIGEGHVVRGNHLQGLEGDGARSALCIMNGIKDSPANGYLQVKKAEVAGNTIVDCRHSMVIGFADKDVVAEMPPECSLRNNVVVARGGTIVELLDPAAKLEWSGNEMYGAQLGIEPVPGISTTPKAAFEPAVKKPLIAWTEAGTTWKVPGVK